MWCFPPKWLGILCFWLMGNYDCRGASIGMESRKSQSLSFTCCHLWGEWKRFLYLLLRGKRPLLHYRKSSTFWQPPNQSRRSFKSWVRCLSRVHYCFRSNYEGTYHINPGMRTLYVDFFPFAEMLLCRGKWRPKAIQSVKRFYVHLSLRYHLRLGTSFEILQFTFFELDVARYPGIWFKK